jgi:enterochelin esterase-like enzyme
MRNRTLATSTVLLISAASVLIGAQNTNLPTATRPPVITSPEVLPDHRVVFRTFAPTASQVEVNSPEIGRVPMQKDAAGVWSATTEPLASDIYLYRITIDGAAVADPSNSRSGHFYRSGPTSLMQVPGTPPSDWDEQNVPHGVIAHHVYRSKVFAEDREYYVYQPPGYDPKRRDPYPALYLLHAGNGTAAGWLEASAANVMLDNLIARGAAKPMVVVMPFGYGGNEGFTNMLMGEIVPEVERTYHVSTDPRSRAIAGASMGGGEAIFVGLNHPDRFAYVASFSGTVLFGRSLNSFDADTDAAFPKVNADMNRQLRLLLVACGASDAALLALNRPFKAWLKARGIAFTDIETPGAHTFLVFRRNLDTLLPLLFQDAK